MTLLSTLRALSALNVWLSLFFSLCPSSQSRRPIGVLLSSSTFSRNVSYETMRTGLTTARPLAIDHCFSCETSSAFEALPSMAKGLIASFPSHLTVHSQSENITLDPSVDVPSSFAQFLTRLDGQAITHFCIVDLPASGDCLSKVHINAIHCSCCELAQYPSGRY